MYKTNRQRRKNFILAYSNTRRLLYIIRFLSIFLILYIITFIFFAKVEIKNQNEIKNKFFGNWDIALLDLNKKDLSYFENHAFIKNYSIQYILKTINSKGTKNIVIGESDKNFFNIGEIDILDGRLPQQKHEVAVEQQYLSLLHVDKVGDIIPNTSTIKELCGYQVSGIIENYSCRWKLINWDMDFINCFIIMDDDKTKNDIQLFIQNDKIQRDIQINMLNLRENLNINNNSIDGLLKSIISILIIILVLHLLLIRSYVKNNYLLENKQISINERRKKLFTFFMTVGVIVFSIMSNIILVILFNNIINKNNYYSEMYLLNRMLNGNFDYFISYFGNLGSFSNDGGFALIKESRLIPEFFISNSTKIVTNFFLLCTINIILLLIELDRYSGKKMYYLLNNYYYNFSLNYLLIFSKKLFFDIIIFSIIIFFENYLYQFKIADLLSIMIRGYSIIFIINFIKTYIIHRHIKKITRFISNFNEFPL